MSDSDDTAHAVALVELATARAEFDAHPDGAIDDEFVERANRLSAAETAERRFRLTPTEMAYVKIAEAWIILERQRRRHREAQAEFSSDIVEFAYSRSLRHAEDRMSAAMREYERLDG
jgi:hypothetical protein